MRPAVCLAATLFSLTLTSQTLFAQAVRGIVAAVATGERLQGANALLIDAEGETRAAVLTGPNGEFLLEAPEPGIYMLRVHHAGYKDRSASLALRAGQVVEVGVNLAPEATELEGITVYGQTAETPEQREFLSRRHLPWNYSFDRREIEQLHVGTILEVVHRGTPVPPTACLRFYLDGRPEQVLGANRDYRRYPLDWMYGIEVYRTYLDVPIKYRDPFEGARCGAVLLWSTTPPGYGLGIAHVWSGGLGGSVGAERWVSEISWRPGLADAYVTVARLRAGQYNPADLLGSARAEREEFNPDARPPYASIYAGKQGPAPLFPWKRVVYSRVAIGVSGYLGQSSETIPDADSVIVLGPSTASYFGLGGELALGATLPNGAVRPWIEVRTGTEYLMRIGVRWIRPVLMVGIEVGGGRGER